MSNEDFELVERLIEQLANVPPHVLYQLTLLSLNSKAPNDNPFRALLLVK